MSKKASRACALLGAGLLGAIATHRASVFAAAEAAPAAAPVKIGVRRITESQYRRSVADVFGPDITISARFEPERREEGLLAIGSSQLSLTSSGFEQYFALASGVAEQVVGEKRRATLVPCKPADASGGDDGCARKFLASYGERLFRRPLNEGELAARLATASAGARGSKDFYAGLGLALASLLVAPEFVFRIETAEADPARAGSYRLDAYTKAARLSFLMWDTTPDEELLSAARSGALHSSAGLERQLARLLASPRLEHGARAFFADMLQLDGFDNLVKDPAIYPKFTQAVSDSAREEALKATLDLLIARKQDYRDLFTTRQTFLNRPLASVYNVPFLSATEWAPYSFPEASGRSGVLTQVAFLSLFAHPGTSSPTRRGIKVHEIFMCEPTPDPPADVDFSRVKDSQQGTVRSRLLDHMENTGCTACHRRSDPPGLALEHFDGLGQMRTQENGVPIDVSAELGGARFVGASGLGRYLRDDPRVPACLVRNVFAYGVGRKTDLRDEDYLAAQAKAFAAAGYRVPDLLARIASTPEFFKATIPSGARPAAAKTAAAASPDR
jgi:hypothetical protein